MNEKYIKFMESFWSEPDGFLYVLRQGEFDVGKWDVFLYTLQKINFDKQNVIELHLVKLLWFVPTFMKWQIERVRERYGDARVLEQAISAVEEEYIRIWGMP